MLLKSRILSLLLGLAGLPLFAAGPDDFFRTSVMPILDKYCLDCHDPEDSEGGVLFLDAKRPEDMVKRRSIWHSVAAQLRNRTMPPAKHKLQPPEQERLEVAQWIGDYLRESAAKSGPYAGTVAARRLNRLEYDNTIRDLVGVMLKFSETFPMEGGGGEGFENNGETLYMPPMLMERFLEAAQQVVDAAIVSPVLEKRFEPHELLPAKGPDELLDDGRYQKYPVNPGDEVSVLVPIYVDGSYEFTLLVEPLKKTNLVVAATVDGIKAARLEFVDDPYRRDRPRSDDFDIQLKRGLHAVSFRVAKNGVKGNLIGLRVAEESRTGVPARASVHYGLLGVVPGETPLAPREVAGNLLKRFVSKAFRRPAGQAEVDRFMGLYDRGSVRGDPFEECVKLALKGVLISPDFLYRIERPAKSERIELLDDYEIASRLSYFLWSTMPDDELFGLAEAGRLRDPKILIGQVDRMLGDPKAGVFSRTFVGQWLGTQYLGGRVAPTLNSIQHYYTPEVAKAMRNECELFFHHLVRNNASVLDLIDSDYTYMSGRLAKFYERKDWQEFRRDDFRRVSFSDNRRGGLVGMGAVLAVTSHFKQTSPVLRGAWVFDTLLGTPVPPPPPDVPELAKKDAKGKKLTVKVMLEQHRQQASCSACHNLIDPIGFALENFDFLGRWRERDDGRPLYTQGRLPTGESFDGPEQLRQVLLGRKDVFSRHLIRKMLGYALGRALMVQDEGTVERIARKLATEEYGARMLINEIVLSTPFRNKQRIPPSE
jgi:hypothetical protein